jgi:hypothetical protein
MAIVVVIISGKIINLGAPEQKNAWELDRLARLVWSPDFSRYTDIYNIVRK